jgi:hypothetical protein
VVQDSLKSISARRPCSNAREIERCAKPNHNDEHDFTGNTHDGSVLLFYRGGKNSYWVDSAPFAPSFEFR